MNNVKNTASFKTYRTSDIVTPQGCTQVFYTGETITLPPLCKTSAGYNALYVCDTHTVPILKQAAYFEEAVPVCIFDPGEHTKTLQTVERIIQTAVAAGLDRSAVFIGFGGGVICDMTALAASLYMRGVSCCLIPTTLLAMADAAVGGKTGVNTASYKNIAGTFYAASLVIICSGVLQTLPEQEYHAGLAEILKMGLLYDTEIYRLFHTARPQIKKRDRVVLEELIRRSVEAKGAVIQRDFSEKGERMFLNLGHTFAHALESLTGFTVLHGEAVAWGIARALETGVRAGITDKVYAAEAAALLDAYQWCTAPVYHKKTELFSAQPFADGIIQRMKKDKKNRQGFIRLVLQKNLADNCIRQMEEAAIREVLL